MSNGINWNKVNLEKPSPDRFLAKNLPAGGHTWEGLPLVASILSLFQIFATLSINVKMTIGQVLATYDAYDAYDAYDVEI